MDPDEAQALYLILHKVRGEATYDVAQRLDEELWIIPTSGHRAYPWRAWRIDYLFDGKAITPNMVDRPIPEDWPDHYQGAKPLAKPKAADDLSTLFGAA